jgi:hypothetical protein
MTERHYCAPAQAERKMALYYFHVADGKTVLDEIGTDLPDETSVRAEAVRVSSELLNMGHGERIWGGGVEGVGNGRAERRRPHRRLH